jgi:hypothetical protein
MKRRWRLLLLTSLVTCTMGMASAASQSHVEHAQHPVTLPVAVNGANAPEKIPDDLAYRHFLMALAIPDNATSYQLARRNAFLRPLRLSADDRAGLIGALRGVNEQLDAIAQDARARDGAPDANVISDATVILDRMRVKRTGVLDAARSNVSASMSAEGQLRLNSYVTTHVKSHIIIYGTPPQ